MADSTSPPISRTPHRLEYASSINTTLPSPTAIATYHSSFDFISEPRDCDTLVTMNQDTNCTRRNLLERDFRQLDVSSNQNKKTIKHKKLDRTESISLPTTPTEDMSSSYENKYDQLLSLTAKISDDDRSFFFNSSLDQMTTMRERNLQQNRLDESLLNSRR